MPAVNGVKKVSVTNTNSKGKVGILVPILSAIIAILLTALGFIAFWKFHYETVYRDQIILEQSAGMNQAYVAARDISSGEYLDGAVQLVTIPSNLTSSDLISQNAVLSDLKASREITANTLISEKNCYNPKLQNPILEKTRTYTISYLATPGIVTGDFIDIRLKSYVDNNESTYSDTIVCSKLQIMNKEDSGTIQLQLSESDLLNLNSAVIQAADTENGKRGEIYVGKYVDPANQPKATVTYQGKGIKYTDQELADAQKKLEEQLNAANSGESVNDGTDNTTDVNSVDTSLNTTENVENTDENTSSVDTQG